MEFLSLRTGKPFAGKIPDKLKLSIAVGIGTGPKESSSEDKDDLIRWMFLRGYVPEDEYEEEEGEQ